MSENSEDAVTLTVPRPQQSWFSNSAALQGSIAQAMGALENGAQHYSLASIAAADSHARANTAPAPVAAPPEPVAQQSEPVSHIASLEQSLENLKHDPEQANSLAEELDYELAVGALLDEISTTMDEMIEGKLKPNDQVISLVLDSFQSIAKYIGNVPKHVAEEVGELGADICSVIELKGGNPNAIIALFNP